MYASDILFAILLIIAIFEACRRKMGNPLVIITLVFVAYAFLGKYIPGFLNQPGMTLKKFTSLVYLTTDGIFGSPLYASASYVVLFVLLGAIMSVSGIGDYMTNLATSLFGHMRGGPAKVAVVASGFFGSISGSPPPPAEPSCPPSWAPPPLLWRKCWAFPIPPWQRPP